MNTFRAWGVAAALVAGTTAHAVAADPSGDTADDRPWYKKMFFSAPARPAGPVPRSGPVAATPGRPPVSAPLSPEAAAAAIKAEYAAWDRRMQVCDALRAIAIKENDSALEKQADELDRQANDLYKQRLRALGASNAKAPLPQPSGAGFASSLDLAPEKPTDPKVAASRLTAPSAPVPASGTASVAPSSQPVREVNQ